MKQQKAFPAPKEMYEQIFGRKVAGKEGKIYLFLIPSIYCARCGSTIRRNIDTPYLLPFRKNLAKVICQRCAEKINN